MWLRTDIILPNVTAALESAGARITSIKTGENILDNNRIYTVALTKEPKQ